MVSLVVVAVFAARTDWPAVFAGLLPQDLSYEPFVFTDYPEPAERSVWVEAVVFLGGLGGGMYDYVGYSGFLREKLGIISPVLKYFYVVAIAMVFFGDDVRDLGTYTSTTYETLSAVSRRARQAGVAFARKCVYAYVLCGGLLLLLTGGDLVDLITPANIVGGTVACGVYGFGLLLLERRVLASPNRVGRLADGDVIVRQPAAGRHRRAGHGVLRAYRDHPRPMVVSVWPDIARFCREHGVFRGVFYTVRRNAPRFRSRR